MTAPGRPVVLWWGRSDPRYSRNAILRRAFADLGWHVADFRPAAGALAGVQLRLAPPPPVALVWVPCFRQRDLLAARRFAHRVRVPLCFDPLISAYDKQVEERRKLQPSSARARWLLAGEQRLFAAADRVVADTDAHAAYFSEQLRAPRDRVHVIPVGADESAFGPAPVPPIRGTVEVLFYGSFLPLQGPDVIVRAAAEVRRSDLRLTLLGDGPLRARCEALARSAPQVRFEPWIEQDRLAQRIHAAHLLLGVFGTTPKAGRVIANKVYQALACGRGVVTRDAEAWPAALRHHPGTGLRLVPAGDPRALARVLEESCASPERLAEAGSDAAALYRRWFSAATVREALAGLLASLGLPVDPQPGR
jgi:glycosyltransferase involved in cell wall biosynthesis